MALNVPYAIRLAEELAPRDLMEQLLDQLKGELEVMERLTQFQELLLHMQEEGVVKVCNGQAVQVGVLVVLEAPEVAKAVEGVAEDPPVVAGWA